MSSKDPGLTLWKWVLPPVRDPIHPHRTSLPPMHQHFQELLLWASPTGDRKGLIVLRGMG